MRPATTELGNRIKSRQISSSQEKSIHIVAELEKKGFLLDIVASFIKSLILEDHPEVTKAMASYLNDSIDEFNLSHKLIKLADKLSPYIVRPTSPLPKRGELIRTVNTLVKKRLQDESDIMLLN